MLHTVLIPNVQMQFKCGSLCSMSVMSVTHCDYIRISHILYSLFVTRETMNVVTVNNATTILEEHL